MATTPPPTWPVEPTILYIVSYYSTNALNEEPALINSLLQTKNDAIDKAKELITNSGNVGVCLIQPITCDIVYPSIPWQDF